MNPSQIADLKKVADLVSGRITASNEGGVWMEDGKASLARETDMYLLAGMSMMISAVTGDWSAANLYMRDRTILSPVQPHLYGTVLSGARDGRLLGYDEINSLNALTKRDNLTQNNKGESHAAAHSGSQGESEQAFRGERNTGDAR